MIFGKNGWIGGKLTELLEGEFVIHHHTPPSPLLTIIFPLLSRPPSHSTPPEAKGYVKGKDLFLADSRLENREAVSAELDLIKPSHVLNAAGVTGRPNVDWCEDNKAATVRANVIGTLNLSDLCELKDIHCTVFATGCIFEYDEEHPLGAGQEGGFTEEDSANFFSSWYSKTKGMVEQMLEIYPSTCVLRVRMPISDDLSGRNFITKIMKYDRIVDIPNSMTVLHELLPASLVMAEKKLCGIYNFCNVSEPRCEQMRSEESGARRTV